MISWCVCFCAHSTSTETFFFFFKSLLFPVLWFFLIFFFTGWSFHILCALLLFNLLLSIPAPTGFSLRLIVIHSKKKKKINTHPRIKMCHSAADHLSLVFLHQEFMNFRTFGSWNSKYMYSPWSQRLFYARTVQSSLCGVLKARTEWRCIQYVSPSSHTVTSQPSLFC